MDTENQPTVSSDMQNPDNPTSGDLLKGIDDKKRIAQLEHEIFTVCKQLDEKSEKLKEFQEQNALQKERVKSLEEEKLQKAQFLEELVQNRDNLIYDKSMLQNEKLALERRKDELESQISKLTNDKRRHLDDIDLLRNQCETLKTDKIQLQAQIDDFRSEKAALAYDKDQWAREKEVLTMSKQWYMNEISNREQKINELRIDMIRERAEMQREITLLSEKANDAERTNVQLVKTVEEREQELAELQDKFKKMIEDHTVKMNEIDAEMRTRERLTNVYKEAQEASEKEIDELRDNEARLEHLLRDKEEALQNISTEMAASMEQHKKEIKNKDDEIKRLTEEVTKSTELLNAGFRLNRADEDFIRLTPAAAAASSLMKSGLSLTGIYTEHCRVVSELEKRNTEFAQLERHVTELIQELDSKAPRFQDQKKAYEKMCERNECLRLQNELLGAERQKLQSKSDSATRELEFTKRELERFQRQYNISALQVQRLLYIIERGSGALTQQNVNGDGGAADNILFSNIKELQTKNIELLEQLERLRGEQQKIIENYHNSEIESLKQAHGQAQEELKHLRENFNKQDLLIREISEQRDQYKNLYDQLVSPTPIPGMSSNASTASEGGAAVPIHPYPSTNMNLSNLQADLLMWRTKAERFQETIAYLNDDRQTHERILNSRIDQQLEQISAMRTTIGKLESDLEFQNKNQQLLAKQIDSYAIDLKKSQDQLGEAKRQTETLQFKFDTLTNQILEKQQELSILKVQNHSLSEQYAISTSREQRLKAELEILRNNQYSSERVTSTLQEMEFLLKRVNAEKEHTVETQLQSALLERDNLRQLVDSLNEQHHQLVNGLKSNLNAACSERDKAQSDLKAVQNRLDGLERIYEQLKKDNEKMQNEMEQIQSTDTNVEACKKEMQKMKNTITYHEKQLAEFEQKCEELNHTIERKDKQLEEICRLGTDMESSIQYGTLERQRMQAVREQLEADLQTNKKLVEELRNNLDAREMELLSQAKLLSESNNQIEEMNGKHEQKLLELEKNLHESKLQIEQFQEENDRLKIELENTSTKCKELSENNFRMATDLAKEIAKTEKQTQEMADLTIEHNTKIEKMQRSMDVLEQEKLRMQDEVKAFMERDKEHLEKHNSLYDEIQRLLKQVEFMERLQTTISSPSPNVSLNASALNASTFSPTPGGGRLSFGETAGGSAQSQQQHTDRINTIIGYIRSEKQKETELRMHAELEVQRIRAQAEMDQQRILQLDTELGKLRGEVEANARIAIEKEQLLNKLNVLGDVQTRYQDLKKTFDNVSQQFTQLRTRTQELEQLNIKMQADRKNLEAKLESATKICEERGQQNKTLQERCERAMAMASKYSPEMVNSLQSDNEKMRSDVLQKDRDLALVKKEHDRISEELAKIKGEHSVMTEDRNSLKEKLDQENKNLNTVKQFARKLRDEKVLLETENTKIKSELKSIQDELLSLKEKETAAAASAATTAAANIAASFSSAGILNVPMAGQIPLEIRRKLNEELANLRKENEALLVKIANATEIEAERDQLRVKSENLQREMDDMVEKVMRIDMVEKAYKNSQQRIQTLMAEIKQLQEENEKLQKNIQEMVAFNIEEIERPSSRREMEPSASSAAGEGISPAGNPNQSEMPNTEIQSKEDQQGRIEVSPKQAISAPSDEMPSEILNLDEEKMDDPFIQQMMDKKTIGEMEDEVATALLEEGNVGEEQQQQPTDGGEEEFSLGIGNDNEQQNPDQLVELAADEAKESPESPPREQQQHWEEEYVDDGEEGFGDLMPSEAAGGGQQRGENEEEIGGGDEELEDEEEEEDIGDEEEDLDEEFMDEEEEGDLFPSDAAAGYQEEGDEMSMSLDAGEPPRKQRRVHEQQQQQMKGDQQAGASGNVDPPADEDDDDDDIQLL